MFKNIILACFFLFSGVAASSQSKVQSPDKVVNKIKELLRENYIIEEKIKVLSDSLSAARYDKLNQEELVDRINLLLLRCSNDKHLRLELNPRYAQKLLGNSSGHDEQKADERRTNFGFEKLEILPGNIGFLKLSYFAEPTDLDDLIKSVFAFLQNTDKLIIDLRGNRGGSGVMLQKLVSGFLPNDSSVLLSVAYKNNTVSLKTDREPLFRYQNPIFLLCDQNTFSASEGFALVLQNRRRALVVGEITAGAGNIAGPYAVDKNFVITIPVGVIVDPRTGLGWEGRGVIPDTIVSSQNALQKAIEMTSFNGK